MDLVRKNWPTVPSVRNSLEWRTSSRVDDVMDGRSADMAIASSLAVGEWYTEQDGEERKPIR